MSLDNLPTPDKVPPKLQFRELESGEINLEELSPLERAAASLAMFVYECQDRFGEHPEDGMETDTDVELQLKRVLPPDFMKPDEIVIGHRDLADVSTFSYYIGLNFPTTDKQLSFSADFSYDVLPGLGDEEEVIVNGIELGDQSFELSRLPNPLEREKYIESFINGVNSLRDLLTEGYEVIDTGE